MEVKTTETIRLGVRAHGSESQPIWVILHGSHSTPDLQYLTLPANPSSSDCMLGSSLNLCYGTACFTHCVC